MRCILIGRLFTGGWMALLCAAAMAMAQEPGLLSRLPPLEEAAAPQADAAGENSDASASPDDVPPPDGVEQSVDEKIAPPWYTPDVLFASESWEGSFEFGINGTTGNAETFSFRAGADTKHKTACNTLAVNLAYARTQADGEETQNNAQLNLRDDWDFADSPWSMFIRQSTLYDEFTAFDVRISANTGVGYFFVKQPGAKLKGRVGSGFSREIGGPNDAVVAEAVFGADVETKITDRQKIEATMDYLPEWADWDDYRFESRASWSIKLATDANLSLKFSVFERYDSTPEGRRPNDLDYALLLLWKL